MSTSTVSLTFSLGSEEQPMMVASLETLSDCHNFLWNHNDPGILLLFIYIYLYSPACEKVKKTVDNYLSGLTIKIDSTPDQIRVCIIMKECHRVDCIV